jgi:hypothetical protein
VRHANGKISVYYSDFWYIESVKLRKASNVSYLSNYPRPESNSLHVHRFGVISLEIDCNSPTLLFTKAVKSLRKSKPWRVYAPDRRNRNFSRVLQTAVSRPECPTGKSSGHRPNRQRLIGPGANGCVLMVADSYMFIGKRCKPRLLQ